LLPAPTAPSEGYAGIRNLVDRSFRPTDPLSILAHQLRRRFPSCISLFRGARLIYSTTWPESSLVVRSARPGWNRDPSQNRPMFRGPSWKTLYRVPLRSPSSSPPKRLEVGSRVARQEDFSSGASSRLTPTRTREFPSLPAGGDRTFGHLPRSSCPCGPSEEAGTAVPITKSPCTSRPSRGSKIFGNKPVDNGDSGGNSWNFVENPDSRLAGASARAGRLPFRSPPLTSGVCLNLPFRVLSPHICRC
jgi:hypothetical protein